MNAFKSVLVLTVLVMGTAALPRVASAHCDTLDGPVVADARLALDKGDVTPVLRWVKKDGEAEVTAAFQKTLRVHASGGDARELADRWFFETLVRVHRAGEGAPYTGLKPAGTEIPHFVLAADNALDGKIPVDTLVKHLGQIVAEGIEARFAKAAEARKHAGDSVEAGREYVAAYVQFVHYVEGLAQTAGGQGGHHHEE